MLEDEESVDNSLLCWSTDGLIFRLPIQTVANLANITITMDDLSNFQLEDKVSQQADGSFFLHINNISEPITNFFKLRSTLKKITTELTWHSKKIQQPC